MAKSGRPVKNGIDYFSLDVEFDTDLEMVLQEFGEKGLGIVIRIWQHLYKSKYYMPYNKDELLMIKRRCSDASLKEIKDILEVMIEKNLFNKKLFEQYNILTSPRIQNNFLVAKPKSTHFTIYPELILVNTDKIGIVSYLDRNKPPKGKESKKEEIILDERENKLELNEKKELARLSQLLEQEFNRLITADDIKYIEQWVKDYSDPYDTVKEALLVAVNQNILKCSYINGILENKKDGFVRVEAPTLEEVFGEIVKS